MGCNWRTSRVHGIGFRSKDTCSVQLNENLEQHPHLSELIHCYSADWVHDENKYGHYQTTHEVPFENQIFEGLDTDLETEMYLTSARQKMEDASNTDFPSTSGRQFSEAAFSGSKYYCQCPLTAYEPAFGWENERAMACGQRILIRQEYGRGLKICVRVLSFFLQAGLAEPFHGTICLYNRERREKISENFFFRLSQSDLGDASTSQGSRCIFHLDAPSGSVCLLIQLEKPATEEGGVSSSVYSRREPIHLTEREKQRLQVWSRIMPYRESFAWAMVPLFDTGISTFSGGSTSPGSPLAHTLSASSSRAGTSGPSGKISDCNLYYSRGNNVVIEVSNLNKIKECYTEDTLQDPKRNGHKLINGVLKLEIEKFLCGHSTSECSSEYDSLDGDSLVALDQIDHPIFSKCTDHVPHGLASGNSDTCDGKESNVDSNNVDEYQAFDFATTGRSEPFLQPFHFLYVYPLSINLTRKRNLFVRVELRRDYSSGCEQSMEAMYSTEPGVPLQKWVNTQVAVGVRMACFHDEIKLLLPSHWTDQHHILFSFFHIDLQMRLEAPEPVVIGYAVLPLVTYAECPSEISLPIIKEFIPQLMQDTSKGRLDYLEEGKSAFRLRLRLCSSLYSSNERIRDFFFEYDRQILHTSPPWGSELLEAINGLKNVEPSLLIQFLHPLINMLLQLVGSGGETLQVAAFRAMVNILTRVQQESSDDADRSQLLVNFVDYVFDDFAGRVSPVYTGLSTVWGSLARSKAKGYRVGPVYDDVLTLAWFFLELIVKSMGLEQGRLHFNSLPLGDDIPPMPLKESVFRCITQLYDCLLNEVHDRCKKGLSLAKRLNSSLAFFSYDLLSIIEPRQVFELVALYLDKFSGICPSNLHDCKLVFLQIVCDHDLFVEMPGRDPSDRNYLSSVLIQEVFLAWDHDDLAQRAKAARILVVLVCKHEYDVRYQKSEDKLYIAQLYFPLIGQILDEMPIFYNMDPREKREVLIVILQIICYLDDISLIKAWQQSVARTRLFFKLMEECLTLFEHKRLPDEILVNPGSHGTTLEGAASPKYSNRLSPTINSYLSEASRHEVKPQGTPEDNIIWQRVNSHISSPNKPYSLREALAHAQSSRVGTSTQALRESLHPMLRQKLELWEENLSASVSLQVFEVMRKFSEAVAANGIATDYGKLECITAILTSFFLRSQPLTFWMSFLPIFHSVFDLHGPVLFSRENDRFLKQITFHLLRLAVFRNVNIRNRAVIGLRILIKSSFYSSMQIKRLRVLMTITLSELMSDIQMTQMKPDGMLEESGECCRLRESLKEMADEALSSHQLKDCGMSENVLLSVPEKMSEQLWSWSAVKSLSWNLLCALDASLEHAVLASMMTVDRYAATESFYKLASAFALVPDLHIMWLLHLCDAHQEMQSWAEAAQCATAVAGVVMQALVSRKDGVWSGEHVSALRNICPLGGGDNSLPMMSSVADVEGYGVSKLTVDSAVKYLQLANKLFSLAELYHFCANILELIIPVYKSRRAYGQLAKCHTLLTNIYESIVEQEGSPIPFTDATYYRVGFYGDTQLHGKEYVYRETCDVRLGDIMQKLKRTYESMMGDGVALHIIPDSRQVKEVDLQSGACYVQITSVDPVMDEEDLLGSRKDRIFCLSTGGARARVFNRFLFDTPFTKSGRTQGSLVDQWKRRTVLQTHGSFPALVNRLLVVKSESVEFSPIENAIGMIETRTAALRNELEEPRNSDGDQLPRLQSLQRILQGSVAVQVNSGLLSVCTAFLSGEPTMRLCSQELQQLITALLEFMAVCKRAIRVHFRLIGDEDQDFHTQLVNGFQSLTAELSRYIPAILSEL